MSGHCCSPSAEGLSAGDGSAGARTGPPLAENEAGRGSLGDAVNLPGGAFSMGSDDPLAYPDDGEGPARNVTVGAFRIETTTVTNTQFGAFIAATGYRTDAERYGWSFVFAGELPDVFPPTRGAVQAPWWRQIEGATWNLPGGPLGCLTALPEHPVVHVSWNDANAYATWVEGRLPTEVEWEYAARGGLVQQNFPWGSDREPGGQHRMNVWQGTFPSSNSEADGWYATAPARSFEPNAYGLFNMTGNVWEWCSDWFTPGQNRVAKGGSYLCHESYCRRYRVSARQGLSPDSTTGNTGFRCVIS